MPFGPRIPPGSKLFLTLLAITTVVWMLRGFGLLSFLPGMVIWMLILLCFATGILNSLRSIR